MPTDSDFHITKAGANNPHWEEIQVRVQENSIEDGGKKRIPCILCQHSCSSSCTRLLESLGAIHTWEVTDNDVNLSISSKNGTLGLKSNGEEPPRAAWAGAFAPIPALGQQLLKEAKNLLLVSSIFLLSKSLQ